MGTLNIIEGDITRAGEAIITHGANIKGVAGAGVALALREAFPRAFTAYAFACGSGALAMGDVVWGARDVTEERFIAHIITQSQYGRDPARRYASYDAIDKGVRAVLDRAESLRHESVAITAIGTGLGGASWPVVKEILLGAVANSPANLNVYEMNKAVLARLQDQS